MAPSVLGKRARAGPTESPESTKGSSSISSRVKRRAIINDENADPKTTQHEYRSTPDDNGMQLDAPEESFSPDHCAEVVAKPNHCISRKECAALSPKISGHFKVTKAIPRESKNSIQLVTPQTPRHRDALSKKIPVTPRHRVGLVQKALTPRALRTPSTPTNSPTVYSMARRLFSKCAEPGRLIGREQERKELNSFIQGGIQMKSGRCLYVSGPPGTGKSALVAEVCHEIQGTPHVQTAYVNCMSVKSSKDVYVKLLDDLIEDVEHLEENEMVQMRTIFLPKKKSPGPTYIVTLDEIDHLLELDLEILYTLFEWSLHHSSRLVLIGIANALDLTDRFLPRLKARNLKPQLLPFLPYTAPQIASVITTKLKTLSSTPVVAQPDDLPFLHPTAIQFCAKKVASQTGDLRKAFDMVSRTIDLVEDETRHKYQATLASQVFPTSPGKTPLHENPNLSSPFCSPATPATSLSILSPSTAPRATIAHIARVSASAFSHGTPQRLQTLNLQQKAALCALISLEKSNRRCARSIFTTPSKTSAAPTIRTLYDTYCVLCKRENALHPLTATEFMDVVGGLETLGLVGEVDVKGLARGKSSKKSTKGEDRRIVSFTREADLEGSLEGVGGGILRGLLKGDDWSRL